MERGQMRVEANVSLRQRGTEPFGTRIEVKNMNSFRSVERAVAYEIERQAGILESGGSLSLETRGWSDDRGETYRMRGKETSEDYRYFPEPDLPPLRISREWLSGIAASLPELPAARRSRLASSLGLSAYDARLLADDPDAGALFEEVLDAESSLPPKTVANWVSGEYLRLRNLGAVGHRPEPGELAALIGLVEAGTISRASGKAVLERHAATGEAVAAIVEREGLRQISDASALDAVVAEAVAANPAAVADYRTGKDQAVKFLVGQVMKASGGSANPKLAQELLRERLSG
jgi:aspartyl-tRNA(Asn)/glutamyl-tRNA(Gln) amidotransferase subunit B